MKYDRISIRDVSTRVVFTPLTDRQFKINPRFVMGQEH